MLPMFGATRARPSGAAALLQAYGPEGVAWDFRDLSVAVRDTGTPANNFSGDVNNWFTYTAPSTKGIRNSAGLLVSGSTLRTEYSAALSPLGVRVEPAATNLVLRSQEMDNVYWTASRSTVTANAIAAPDGTTTAEKLVEDTATGTHCVYSTSATITAGATVTASAFFKAGERTRAQIRCASNGETNGARASFNLSTGAQTATSATGTGTYISSTSESWLNGWWRISLTCRVDPAATITTIYLNVLDAIGTEAYTGDGASGLYVWGAQVEVGRWASSYVATTSATVTRAADSVTKLITAMPFSATAGTLFAEFSTASPDLVTGVSYIAASFNDATINNFTALYRYITNIGSQTRTGGVFQTDLLRSGIVTGAYEMHRNATAYEANNCIGSVNGALTSPDISASLPTVTRLQFSRSDGLQTGGHMMRGLYVPSRVSNANLPTFGGTA